MDESKTLSSGELMLRIQRLVDGGCEATRLAATLGSTRGLSCGVCDATAILRKAAAGEPYHLKSGRHARPTGGKYFGT